MEAYPWVVGDYDFDPQELQASKKRPIASHGVACQASCCWFGRFRPPAVLA